MYNLTSNEARKAVRNASIVYANGVNTTEKALAYCNSKGISEALKSIIVGYITYKNAMDSATTVTEYLKQYANFKLWAYTELSDYGALSDLFECLIRVASKKNLNLVKLSDIRVKTSSQVDVILNGVKFEIASNGKTWTQGNEFDYMQGNFNGVIYGVYSLEDMLFVIDCINQNKTKEAVNYIAKLACIWIDKYQFLDVINSLSRGKGITYKSCLGKPQMVFNPSKYKAFLQAIGTENYNCYGDTYFIK